MARFDFLCRRILLKMFDSLVDKFNAFVYNNKTGLDGELTVPCDPQPVIAGSNSCLGVVWSNMCKNF